MVIYLSPVPYTCMLYACTYIMLNLALVCRLSVLLSLFAERNEEFNDLFEEAKQDSHVHHYLQG